MAHEIVKYRNDFNNISFNNFNSTQSNIFFGILSRLRDQGTKRVTLSFSHIARLSGIHYGRRLNLFYRDLRRTYHKILGLTIYQNNRHKYTEISLFSKFTIDKDKKTVTIVINPFFLGLLNHLAKQFTRFSLKQYTVLKSRYAKTLFRQIKAFRTTGKVYLPMKKFRRVMGIPKSYSASIITRRVINPCKVQLTPIIRNLHIITNRKASGNQVTGYTIIFKPVNTTYDKLMKFSKSNINTYKWMVQNIKFNQWLTDEQKIEAKKSLDEAFNVKPNSMNLPLPKHKRPKKKKYEPIGAFNRTLDSSSYEHLKYLYKIRNTSLVNFSPYQIRKLKKRIRTIKTKVDRISQSIYGDSQN